MTQPYKPFGGTVTADRIEIYRPNPSGKTPGKDNRVNLRYIDWIWHIRGDLPLEPRQSNDDAFDRLEPLFEQPGTSHRRTNDTVTFHKKNQAAQDPLSIIDDGTLQIRSDGGKAVLHYHLISRSLLLCFLAPLLFLSFALLTILLSNIETSSADANKAKEAAELAKKSDKNTQLPQNWIDKALGAPVPEKPKKDADKSDGQDEKRAPTAAYVFASLFVILYVVGRILEPRLIRSLFAKRLRGV